MQAPIPHGQPGHQCNGQCNAPTGARPLLFSARLQDAGNARASSSLEAATKEEYSCAHPTISSEKGLEGIITNIDFRDQRTFAPARHNAGHFELSEASFSRGVPLVKDLHEGLLPVFEIVSAESSAIPASEASLTAMVLRMTSVDLLKKTASLPDFGPLEKAWDKIFANASEQVVGEVVANIMAIYKQADEVNKTAGTGQSLAINFARTVMSSVGEKIYREGESPIRRWFVQSLPSAHYNNLSELYCLMLAHGSHQEIDVALNAIDYFASNSEVGGQERNSLAGKYKSEINRLLSGNGNPFITEGSLNVVSKYGRPLSFLDKSQDILRRT